MQTLLFHFPQAASPGLAYIVPSVRIELGARSDHWPSEEREIRSYLGEAFDPAIGKATVRSLAAERTFWEKATLLHAEAHRPKDKLMPLRYARHYHDMARLAESPVAARALADVALEAADVALMSDDLTRLPFAVELGRATRTMIRQNVIFSMAVVVGLIPLTLFGLVPLSVAVICHEGSTVLVALHGLRLLSRRDRFARTSI